jgi:hypothetical protein
MASRALQDLPATNQTVAIRKKLQAFKQAMIRDFIYNIVNVCMAVLVATLLLDYCLFIGGFLNLFGMLPSAIVNLTKLLPRSKKQSAIATHKGQPRTVQT